MIDDEILNRIILVFLLLYIAFYIIDYLYRNHKDKE
jgi:hypothetical protein